MLAVGRPKGGSGVCPGAIPALSGVNGGGPAAGQHHAGACRVIPHPSALLARPVRCPPSCP